MDWDDIDDILFVGTPEQIAAVRCPKCDGELLCSYNAETRGTEIRCQGSCGTVIKGYKSSCVPNYAKTTMLVDNAINITGRGTALIGDTKQGEFKKGQMVEILRNNVVIGCTEVNGFELISRLDRDCCLGVMLRKVDGVDVVSGDYIRQVEKHEQVQTV